MVYKGRSQNGVLGNGLKDDHTYRLNSGLLPPC